MQLETTLKRAMAALDAMPIEMYDDLLDCGCSPQLTASGLSHILSTLTKIKKNKKQGE